jgi:hypothetical protein
MAGDPDGCQNMNANLIIIDICDETSLLKACDILHDASFDPMNAKFDVQTATWTAVFHRDFFEDVGLVSERSGILFTTFTYPMAESVLELRGITACDILDRSRIGTYTFNECQVSRGRYRFLFCESMEVVVTFREKPSGSLRDIRLLDENGSYTALRNPFRRRLKKAHGIGRKE